MSTNLVAAAKVPVDITVTLPDGKTVPGQSWRTTPYDIASGISKGLVDSCVVTKVNGEVWDLDRVLELNKFDVEEGHQRPAEHPAVLAAQQVHAGHFPHAADGHAGHPAVALDAVSPSKFPSPAN